MKTTAPEVLCRDIKNYRSRTTLSLGNCPSPTAAPHRVAWKVQKQPHPLSAWGMEGGLFMKHTPTPAAPLADISAPSPPQGPGILVCFHLPCPGVAALGRWHQPLPVDSRIPDGGHEGPAVLLKQNSPGIWIWIGRLGREGPAQEPWTPLGERVPARFPWRPAPRALGAPPAPAAVPVSAKVMTTGASPTGWGPTLKPQIEAEAPSGPQLCFLGNGRGPRLKP